ncbi:ankyrin repeat domain-containing protein SOWAHD [Mustela lutreola]|uniref:ankyrin repeat domain-containing protein SOWAHD n=1 Tax=Mustela lutreola TaxID=9666 RepID=UPI002796F320|nr:ankyrin repeat domain-containing protein SOWAHD [Mustela lutreola]
MLRSPVLGRSGPARPHPRLPHRRARSGRRGSPGRLGRGRSRPGNAERQFLSRRGPGRAANARPWKRRGSRGRTMAEPRGTANPGPKASLAATALSPRSAPQLRPWKVDPATLGRYRGHAAASRDPLLHGSMLLPAAGSGRRRGALRELLGLQGAAPAGWPSEDRAEEPSPAGPNGPNGPGGGGLCLEPHEHAWILAAAEGRLEVLWEQLEAEPALLLRCDPITGYTVLHWLAKHGCHEELILVHDFAQRRGLQLDVSASGSGGLTPLHLAALQGHDMVIKVLVGALGADPSRRDYSGHRACHYLRPDAPQSLRELSGAEDWETAGGCERINANNNSSGGAAWAPRRTPSWVGTSSMETPARAAASPCKEKNYTGSRVVQIQGLLRQMFPFFQDR